MNSTTFESSIPQESMCMNIWSNSEEYLTVGFIVQTIILSFFICIVICGNILVVIAIISFEKLRTITNIYIVSLAFSDLLLGVLVLPFSGTNEVLQHWIFGDMWCDIWLALDVWICTASILNLCAISFDRYLAISKPFKYQTRISPVRAKLIVTAVWIFAFIICLPPLIGWNEKSTSLVDVVEPNLYSAGFNNTENIYTYQYDKRYIYSKCQSNFTNTTTTHLKNCSKIQTCQLTSEPGYILYSALGSFWIPVWIMVFFYGRIYMIASKTTHGVKKGVIKTTSNCSSIGSSPVILRIHQGGLVNNKSRVCQTEPLQSSLSTQNEEHVTKNEVKVNEEVAKTSPKKSSAIKVTFCRSAKEPLKNHCSKIEEYQMKNSKIQSSIEEETSMSMSENGVNEGETTEQERCKRRKHIKKNMKSLNKERKAAKTVGIIVGCFILCWAPFFTVYLSGVICKDCIPKLMFTLFFWLGYSNSAINPFVYALFSRDFRFAIKHIITCQWIDREKILRTKTVKFKMVFKNHQNSGVITNEI